MCHQNNLISSIIVLLALALLLVSCGKIENNLTPEEKELNENWKKLQEDPVARTAAAMFNVESKEDLKKLEEGVQRMSQNLDKLTKRREEEEKRAEEAAAKEEEEKQKLIASHTLELGQSLTIDGIEFKPIRIAQKKVKGIRKPLSGQESEIQSKEEVLVLYCEIRNITEGQVFSPVTLETLQGCPVTDNFNNRMSPFVPSAILGATRKDFFEDQDLREIKPNEILETTVMAKKPVVENADSFTWELHFQKGNDDYYYDTGWNDDWQETIWVKFKKNQIIK